MEIKKFYGKFRNVGIPIRVNMHRGTGPPENVDLYDHSHDFTELSIVHGGTGIHRINGQDYPVVPGDVFVILPDQTHAYPQREDMQYLHVTYASHRLPLPTEHLNKLPGYHALFRLEPSRRKAARYPHHLRLKPSQLADVIRHIQRMKQEYKERNIGYEAFLLAQLVELMVMLSREYTSDSVGGAEPLLRVGEVISQLEKNYTKNWRLEQLCKFARLSKSTLMTTFREATGLTPIEYLIHVRIRHAMHLLLATEDTITQIAFTVGFSDSNYFARQFRKVKGQSPTEYRSELA